MEKDIFVFDIDGTLIADDYSILDSTQNTLKEISQKGNLIVLASARPLMSLKKIAKKLSAEITAIIALNGALIYYNEDYILEEPISSSTFKKIIKVVAANKLQINVYTKNKWYSKGQSFYLEKEMEATGLKPILIDNFFEIKAEVFKILLLGEKTKIKKTQLKLQEEFNSIAASISNPNYCEIVKQGSSKGKALQELIKKLKINYQPGRLIVFGDGENDIEMMNLADCSIAMENGSESLKRVSDYVTLNNNSNAITYAVEKYNLL